MELHDVQPNDRYILMYTFKWSKRLCNDGVVFCSFFFFDCWVISLCHTSIKPTNVINELYIMNTELWLRTGTSVCARSFFWGKKKKELVLVEHPQKRESSMPWILNGSLDLLSSTNYGIKEQKGSILGTHSLGVTSSVHASSSLLGLQESWKSAHQLASCL